jgi:hypothetical protein
LRELGKGRELGNLCTELVGDEDKEVAGRSPASPIKVWPFLLHALAVMADEMN